MRTLIGCGVVVAVLVVLLASPVSSEARGPHVYVGGTVWIGPGYWGPDPWWEPPYYPYPAPSVIVLQPPVYVQPEPAPPPQTSAYWYYCQNPQGYYPYVQQCPNGWMQVVPPTTPPR